MGNVFDWKSITYKLQFCKWSIPRNFNYCSILISHQLSPITIQFKICQMVICIADVHGMAWHHKVLAPLLLPLYSTINAWLYDKRQRVATCFSSNWKIISFVLQSLWFALTLQATNNDVTNHYGAETGTDANAKAFTATEAFTTADVAGEIARNAAHRTWRERQCRARRQPGNGEQWARWCSERYPRGTRRGARRREFRRKNGTRRTWVGLGWCFAGYRSGWRNASVASVLQWSECWLRRDCLRRHYFFLW